MDGDQCNEHEEPSPKSSLDYWKNIDADEDGMLGGMGFVSPQDIKFSEKFLRKNLSKNNNKLAIDLGCGIGRVSKHLLIKYFEAIDLLDITPHFLEQAKLYFGNSTWNAKIRKVFNESLQSFSPDLKTYDCIWFQWSSIYLPDNELISFLQRCKMGLIEETGFIVVKENIATGISRDHDNVDCGITRTQKEMLDIFTKADLHVYDHAIQPNFPAELYPVHLFLLR